MDCRSEPCRQGSHLQTGVCVMILFQGDRLCGRGIGVALAYRTCHPQLPRTSTAVPGSVKANSA